MDCLSLIREFLQDRLGLVPERITEASTLASLGVDSLMQLELVFEFEDRLGISLPPDTRLPKTVGELLRLVEHHTQATRP